MIRRGAGLLACCVAVVYATANLAQDPQPVVKLPLPTAEPDANGPANLDFESGEVNKSPAAWSLDQGSRVGGYTVEFHRDSCHTGSGCAVLLAGPQVERHSAGALLQPFTAEPYQGKRMRLRAWVKLEGGRRGDSIKIAFTTDGEKSAATFVQKGRGVHVNQWTLAEVEGKVPRHAELIHILVSLSGHGKAWIDDVSFEEVK